MLSVIFYFGKRLVFASTIVSLTCNKIRTEVMANLNKQVIISVNPREGTNSYISLTCLCPFAETNMYFEQ